MIALQVAKYSTELKQSAKSGASCIYRCYERCFCGVYILGAVQVVIVERGELKRSVALF